MRFGPHPLIPTESASLLHIRTRASSQDLLTIPAPSSLRFPYPPQRPGRAAPLRGALAAGEAPLLRIIPSIRGPRPPVSGIAPPRPLPLASICATQRPGQLEPRALTREAVSQRGRAEPGFLKGSLFSCCITARRRGARVDSHRLSSAQNRQALSTLHNRLQYRSSGSQEISFSPLSPEGAPVPTKLALVPWDSLSIQKRGV